LALRRLQALDQTIDYRASTEDGAIAVATPSSGEETTVKISQKYQRLRIPGRNISETMDTYSHLLPNVQENVERITGRDLA
jgi:hypothetical protein